jgi:hypothetical protein
MIVLDDPVRLLGVPLSALQKEYIEQSQMALLL